MPKQNASAPARQKKARPPVPPRYTIQQVADAYHCSPRTVRQWVRLGELEAINVASAGSSRPRLLVPDESLRKFDERRLAASTVRQQSRRRQPAAQDAKRFV